MPVHDWSRVDAGTFHDFHCTWIIELKRALNESVLPADYYAQAEQQAGDITPDVVTLHHEGTPEESFVDGRGGLLTLEASPPKVQYTATQSEASRYAHLRRRVVIRHSRGDDVVAIIEIVSPGNKNSRHALEKFVAKAAGILDNGCHLLVLDLVQRGSYDPRGIHAAIWEYMHGTAQETPSDKPLTLASYASNDCCRAYVQPLRVGDTFPDMPLFLKPTSYVNVPLERTYNEAFAGVPGRWREELQKSN